MENIKDTIPRSMWLLRKPSAPDLGMSCASNAIVYNSIAETGAE